jgi:hypothetical protein
MARRKFQYDVFLSHNSAQKDWARNPARCLREDGFKVWFTWRCPGMESNSEGVLITRKLLILRSARRAKKATLPGRRYKIGTKIHSQSNHCFSANTKIPEVSLVRQATNAGLLLAHDGGQKDEEGVMRTAERKIRMRASLISKITWHVRPHQFQRRGDAMQTFD